MQRNALQWLLCGLALAIYTLVAHTARHAPPMLVAVCSIASVVMLIIGGCKVILQSWSKEDI